MSNHLLPLKTVAWARCGQVLILLCALLCCHSACAAPTWFSLLPRSVPGDGGHSVTVLGQGFVVGQQYRCRFSGAASQLSAASYPLSSDTIVCQSPAWQSSSGSASISIIDAQGQSIIGPQSFDKSEIWISSVVTSVSPTSVLAAGGSSITIHGNGFDSSGTITASIFGVGASSGQQSVSGPCNYISATVVICKSPAWLGKSGNHFVTISQQFKPILTSTRNSATIIKVKDSWSSEGIAWTTATSPEAKFFIYGMENGAHINATIRSTDGNTSVASTQVTFPASFTKVNMPPWPGRAGPVTLSIFSTGDQALSSKAGTIDSLELVAKVIGASPSIVMPSGGDVVSLELSHSLTLESTTFKARIWSVADSTNRITIPVQPIALLPGGHYVSFNMPVWGGLWGDARVAIVQSSLDAVPDSYFWNTSAPLFIRGSVTNISLESSWQHNVLGDDSMFRIPINDTSTWSSPAVLIFSVNDASDSTLATCRVCGTTSTCNNVTARHRVSSSFQECPLACPSAGNCNVSISAGGMIQREFSATGTVIVQSVHPTVISYSNELPQQVFIHGIGLTKGGGLQCSWNFEHASWDQITTSISTLNASTVRCAVPMHPNLHDHINQQPQLVSLALVSKYGWTSSDASGITLFLLPQVSVSVARNALSHHVSTRIQAIPHPSSGAWHWELSPSSDFVRIHSSGESSWDVIALPGAVAVNLTLRAISSGHAEPLWNRLFCIEEMSVMDLPQIALLDVEGRLRIPAAGISTMHSEPSGCATAVMPEAVSQIPLQDVPQIPLDESRPIILVAASECNLSVSRIQQCGIPDESFVQMLPTTDLALHAPPVALPGVSFEVVLGLLSPVSRPSFADRLSLVCVGADAERSETAAAAWMVTPRTLGSVECVVASKAGHRLSRADIPTSLIAITDIWNVGTQNTSSSLPDIAVPLQGTELRIPVSGIDVSLSEANAALNLTLQPDSKDSTAACFNESAVLNFVVGSIYFESAEDSVVHITVPWRSSGCRFAVNINFSDDQFATLAYVSFLPGVSVVGGPSVAFLETAFPAENRVLSLDFSTASALNESGSVIVNQTLALVAVVDEPQTAFAQVLSGASLLVRCLKPGIVHISFLIGNSTQGQARLACSGKANIEMQPAVSGIPLQVTLSAHSLLVGCQFLLSVVGQLSAVGIFNATDLVSNTAVSEVTIQAPTIAGKYAVVLSGMGGSACSVAASAVLSVGVKVSFVLNHQKLSLGAKDEVAKVRAFGSSAIVIQVEPSGAVHTRLKISNSSDEHSVIISRSAAAATSQMFCPEISLTIPCARLKVCPESIPDCPLQEDNFQLVALPPFVEVSTMRLYIPASQNSHFMVTTAGPFLSSNISISSSVPSIKPGQSQVFVSDAQPLAAVSVSCMNQTDMSGEITLLPLFEHESSISARLVQSPKTRVDVICPYSILTNVSRVALSAETQLGVRVLRPSTDTSSKESIRFFFKASNSSVFSPSVHYADLRPGDSMDFLISAMHQVADAELLISVADDVLMSSIPVLVYPTIVHPNVVLTQHGQSSSFEVSLGVESEYAYNKGVSLSECSGNITQVSVSRILKSPTIVTFVVENRHAAIGLQTICLASNCPSCAADGMHHTIQVRNLPSIRMNPSEITLAGPGASQTVHVTMDSSGISFGISQVHLRSSSTAFSVSPMQVMLSDSQNTATLEVRFEATGSGRLLAAASSSGISDGASHSVASVTCPPSLQANPKVLVMQKSDRLVSSISAETQLAKNTIFLLNPPSTVSLNTTSLSLTGSGQSAQSTILVALEQNAKLGLVSMNYSIQGGIGSGKLIDIVVSPTTIFPSSIAIGFRKEGLFVLQSDAPLIQYVESTIAKAGSLSALLEGAEGKASLTSDGSAELAAASNGRFATTFKLQHLAVGTAQNCYITLQSGPYLGLRLGPFEIVAQTRSINIHPGVLYVPRNGKASVSVSTDVPADADVTVSATLGNPSLGTINTVNVVIPKLSMQTRSFEVTSLQSGVSEISFSLSSLFGNYGDPTLYAQPPALRVVFQSKLQSSPTIVNAVSRQAFSVFVSAEQAVDVSTRFKLHFSNPGITSNIDEFVIPALSTGPIAINLTAVGPLEGYVLATYVSGSTVFEGAASLQLSKIVVQHDLRLGDKFGSTEVRKLQPAIIPVSLVQLSNSSVQSVTVSFQAVDASLQIYPKVFELNSTAENATIVMSYDENSSREVTGSTTILASVKPSGSAGAVSTLHPITVQQLPNVFFEDDCLTLSPALHSEYLIVGVSSVSAEPLLGRVTFNALSDRWSGAVSHSPEVRIPAGQPFGGKVTLTINSFSRIQTAMHDSSLSCVSGEILGTLQASITHGDTRFIGATAQTTITCPGGLQNGFSENIPSRFEKRIVPIPQGMVPTIMRTQNCLSTLRANFEDTASGTFATISLPQGGSCTFWISAKPSSAGSCHGTVSTGLFSISAPASNMTSSKTPKILQVGQWFVSHVPTGRIAQSILLNPREDTAPSVQLQQEGTNSRVTCLREGSSQIVACSATECTALDTVHCSAQFHYTVNTHEQGWSISVFDNSCSLASVAVEACGELIANVLLFRCQGSATRKTTFPSGCSISVNGIPAHHFSSQLDLGGLHGGKQDSGPLAAVSKAVCGSDSLPAVSILNGFSSTIVLPNECLNMFSIGLLHSTQGIEAAITSSGSVFIRCLQPGLGTVQGPQIGLSPLRIQVLCIPSVHLDMVNGVALAQAAVSSHSGMSSSLKLSIWGHRDVSSRTVKVTMRFKSGYAWSTTLTFANSTIMDLECYESGDVTVEVGILHASIGHVWRENLIAGTLKGKCLGPIRLEPSIFQSKVSASITSSTRIGPSDTFTAKCIQPESGVANLIGHSIISECHIVQLKGVYGQWQGITANLSMPNQEPYVEDIMASPTVTIGVPFSISVKTVTSALSTDLMTSLGLVLLRRIDEVRWEAVCRSAGVHVIKAFKTGGAAALSLTKNIECFQPSVQSLQPVVAGFVDHKPTLQVFAYSSSLSNRFTQSFVLNHSVVCKQTGRWPGTQLSRSTGLLNASISWRQSNLSDNDATAPVTNGLLHVHCSHPGIYLCGVSNPLETLQNTETFIQAVCILNEIGSTVTFSALNTTANSLDFHVRFPASVEPWVIETSIESAGFKPITLTSQAFTGNPDGKRVSIPMDTSSGLLLTQIQQSTVLIRFGMLSAFSKWFPIDVSVRKLDQTAVSISTESNARHVKARKVSDFVDISAKGGLPITDPSSSELLVPSGSFLQIADVELGTSASIAIQHNFIAQSSRRYLKLEAWPHHVSVSPLQDAHVSLFAAAGKAVHVFASSYPPGIVQVFDSVVIGPGSASLQIIPIQYLKQGETIITLKCADSACLQDVKISVSSRDDSGT